MAKILLLIFALVVVYWLFSNWRKGQSARSDKPAGVAEKIVVCARCQLHVPESESVASAGRHYCCEEHRRLDAS